MATLRWQEEHPNLPFTAYRNWKMRDYPLHDHDYFEVFWVESGRLRHQINGRAVQLHSGSLVMIRPEDFHGFVAQSGQTAVFMNIAFPREILQQLKERYFRENNNFFWNGDVLPWSRELSPARLAKLKEWSDELMHSPREPLYIHRFLINLLAEFSGGGDESSSDVPPWLVRACNMAPDEISGGVEAFFRLCGRSREHVARVMRQTMNTTPTDFINMLRMGYARHHLEMSNRDIIDIALDCGMPNMSHFYTVFRKQTGMTPRAYRMRAHEKSIPSTLPAKKQRRGAAS